MALPDIVPSSRSFDTGTERIARFQWRLGGSTRRHYGQYVQEAGFNLVFENIDDQFARMFLEEYDFLGNLSPVSFPAGFTAGMGNPELIASLEPWFFSDPPLVESIFPNVSTVTVSFRADFLGSDSVGSGMTMFSGSTFCTVS